MYNARESLNNTIDNNSTTVVFPEAFFPIIPSVLKTYKSLEYLSK